MTALKSLFFLVLVPGMLTPGNEVTNSSALLLPVGSFRIWFVSMVVETAADLARPKWKVGPERAGPMRAERTVGLH